MSRLHTMMKLAILLIVTSHAVSQFKSPWTEYEWVTVWLVSKWTKILKSASWSNILPKCAKDRQGHEDDRDSSILATAALIMKYKEEKKEVGKVILKIAFALIYPFPSVSFFYFHPFVFSIISLISFFSFLYVFIRTPELSLHLFKKKNTRPQEQENLFRAHSLGLRLCSGSFGLLISIGAGCVGTIWGNASF